MSEDTFQVRSRFPVRQFVVSLLLTAFSVLFIVGGAAHPTALGGIIFIVLGAAGVTMFAGTAVLLVGRFLRRRPDVEFDDSGVRLPGGKFLSWGDLASIVVSPLPGRAARSAFRLVFLPTTAESAAVSPEILALCVTKEVPGIPTLQWSVRVAGASPEMIGEAARRYCDVPFVDAR